MTFSCMSKKSTADKRAKPTATAAAPKPAAAGADAPPTAKPAATTTTAASGSAKFISAISARRSIYNLGDKLPKAHKEVTKIIQEAIRQGPSSFNVQSSRAVILYGAEHAKVWEIVKAALKKVTAAEQYEASEGKVNGCFLAGAGTVLFYEDTAAIKGQQEAFPSYAANFPVWSQHSSAIAQYAVWCALAQDGIGASLQHYNELIDADLRAAFDVPESWQLVAQMPFGSIKKAADAKTYIADEKRFMVLGEE